ncbi:MAG: hypothetical protein CO094_09960 [Anaerolineae bacterium CG_4_9_14_3_um_filter_57_17]|nr:hypothetical protein [bacterium]NCT21840.1 hypothetical protein [bacterium]OIO83624.1 MAG: hypothetical protein AUK01_12130 [Anaerolineae bacterium CG2_30_57_67]PJB65474.1 MAG: hypothetical protein CO094_09960 [Anaerolineae bacterium CG_4_9_14_3_um_filter_57_17]
MTESVFCANHPDVEASLRCNRCDKPICVKCAVHTPTGYRCKECVRAQQKTFDTTLPADYVFGALVAAIGSGIGAFLVSLVGFIGFFGLLIVPAAATALGAAIAEVVRRATGRRRSPLLFRVIFIAVIVGALPAALWQLFNFNWFGIAFQGIYIFIAASTVYYRISGIQIR